MLALVLISCTSTARAAEPVLTTLGPPAATDAGPKAAFSPDGRWLATANEVDHTVTLFSVSKGGVLTQLEEISAVEGAVTAAEPFALAFDSNGELLAVANAKLDTVSMFKVSLAGLERVGPAAGTTSGWSPQSVAFSPVRRVLAAADHNGNGVSVFEVGSGGQLTSRVSSPVPDASAVAFNADGLLAVVSYMPHTVDVYRVGDDRKLIKLDSELAPAGGQGASFNASGRLLATASYQAGAVSVYFVSPAGELTLRSQRTVPGKPFSVAFGPDGLLAAASGVAGSVSVFSVSEAGFISEQSDTAMPAGPRSVSFTQGSHSPYLAVATGANKAVSMFSASPRGRLIAIGSPASTDPTPISVAFHPQGGLLATANKFPNTVSMIRTPTGAALGPIAAKPTGLNPLSVAFSAPDGKFLATANHLSGPTGTVSVFSVPENGVLGSSKDAAPGGRPYALAFQPHGDLLATANKDVNGVSLFRIAADGTPTRIKDREETDPGPVSVAFNPDGDLLATANQVAATVSLFRVLPNDALELVRRNVPTGGAPNSVAFSHDGNQLATANTTGGSVSVFNVLADGQLANRRDTQLATGLTPTAVAFSPKKALLATANLGGDSASLYRVAGDGTLTQLGDPSPTGKSPQSVAFSADGTLIATANNLDMTVSVFTLRAPALDVWITQTPPDDTSQTSATFAFEANYPATFECRLDGSPFTPLCASPVAYSAISEGTREFTVRATDPAGDTQVSDFAQWRVDLTPPLAPSLIRPAGGARNMPVLPQFAWGPTTDASNGIGRYALLVDGDVVATVLPAACTTECTATPQAKLANGAHLWTVRAFDGVGNEITVVPPRALHVDAQPPAAAVPTNPVGNAATTARRPALSWQAADDGTGIGVRSYAVRLDDTLVKTLDAPATTFTPEADLPDGTHRWQVVARDVYDNASESAVGSFIVDTSPPVAVVDGAPNPVREDRSVTFDASRSTDIGSGIARYEWDLTGDGVFERDSGATPSTTHTYGDPRSYVVRLRVTDRAGNSAVGQVVERVTEEPGKPKVLINGGAPFTDSTRVTLEVKNAPTFARDMLVSNSRGFASAQRMPLQRKFRWTLTRGGRDTRTVFVRFLGGGVTASRTSYFDSITVDQGRPEVIAAKLATKNGVPVLRLKADDRGPAGVRLVQVTNDRNDPKAGFRDFSDTVKLAARAGERPLRLNKPVYVRVADRAGNLSRWYTARRAGGSR